MNKKKLRDSYSQVASYVQSQDCVSITAHEMRQLLGLYEDETEASFDFLSVAHYVDEWEKWKPKRWTITVPKDDTLNVDVYGEGGCAFILTGEGHGHLVVRTEARSVAIRAGSGNGNATRDGIGDALRTDEGRGRAVLLNGGPEGMGITGIDADVVNRGPYGEWAESDNQAESAHTM